MAKVKSLGNTSSRKDYSWIDPNPGKGTNYYRLRQVDLGGGQSYSAIRTVVMPKSPKGGLVVSPNPFRQDFTLSFESEDATIATIEVVDVTGRVVWSKSKTVEAGIHSTTIDLHPADSEVYVIRIKIGNTIEWRRVLKL